MKDIIGNKYGNLTVISRAGKTGSVQLIKCMCDCGNETVVRYPNLVSGITTSCGCVKSKTTSENKLIDLTGRTFGELTVLERASEIGSKRVKWKCRCSCGHECVVTGNNLKSGNTTSCGCMKESFNEGVIVHYLEEHHIAFEKEAKFNDLLSDLGNPLRFDFKIYTEDGFFLLEYQGSQHFQTRNTPFGRYEREKSDYSKKEYCKTHNIELVEIIYSEDTIETLKQIIDSHCCVVHDDTVPRQNNIL